MKKITWLSMFLLLMTACAKDNDPRSAFKPTAWETFVALLRDQWYLFAAAAILIIAVHCLMAARRKKCCAKACAISAEPAAEEPAAEKDANKE